MSLLICTENTYHANTRRHRQEEGLFFLGEKSQEIAPQIQEVAPTDSRCDPHHVYGVELCFLWYFGLCGEWILEVAPQNQEVASTMYVAWHIGPCDI